MGGKSKGRQANSGRKLGKAPSHKISNATLKPSLERDLEERKRKPVTGTRIRVCWSNKRQTAEMWVSIKRPTTSDLETAGDNLGSLSMPVRSELTALIESGDKLKGSVGNCYYRSRRELGW